MKSTDLATFVFKDVLRKSPYICVERKSSEDAILNSIKAHL